MKKLLSLILILMAAFNGCADTGAAPQSGAFEGLTFAIAWNDEPDAYSIQIVLS